MPPIAQFWVGVLAVLNGVVPLIFFDRPESKLVLVAFAFAIVTMIALTARFGFARILGAAHFVWIPLVVYLLLRLSETPLQTTYGKYLRLLILVNAVSLLIDISDVVRFAAGNHDELVDLPRDK